MLSDLEKGESKTLLATSTGSLPSYAFEAGDEHVLRLEEFDRHGLGTARIARIDDSGAR